MNFSEYKNIIFDLGAVIINIDFQKTFEAFSKIGNTDVLQVLKKFEDHRILHRYETGEVDDKGFRNLIREEFGSQLSDDQIDDAWNALLLDIPQDRINLILKLKNKYRLFILSNTNAIHIKGVNTILNKTTGIPNLDKIFEKVYYSHQVLLRKPDVAIYEYLLRDKDLKASETIFLDDNLDNIKASERVGITSLWVNHPLTILDLLKDA
ncbi:MAG: HAD family phosphatase [Sporocytophaga sp.]|nr:HAD family phosphatase [Sporocytophaga sp.]